MEGYSYGQNRTLNVAAATFVPDPYYKGCIPDTICIDPGTQSMPDAGMTHSHQLVPGAGRLRFPFAAIPGLGIQPSTPPVENVVNPPIELPKSWGGGGGKILFQP